MRSTIFSGPWKGMAAEVEECSQDTRRGLADLLRIGMDRVLQEYRATGTVKPGPALIATTRPNGSGRGRWGKASSSSPKLDELLRDAQEARAEVDRLRTAWVQFGIRNGEEAKEKARNGGPGCEVWLQLKMARERDAAAVARLAEARLAALPETKR